MLLLVAVLVRSGIVPLHCWMTDLFEHASFGTALLFVTPMVGAYAAVRLVLPLAPDWALHGMAAVVAGHRALRRRHGAGAARGTAVLLLHVSQPLVAGVRRPGDRQRRSA